MSNVYPLMYEMSKKYSSIPESAATNIINILISNSQQQLLNFEIDIGRLTYRVSQKI